jgi:hypothetical protein
LVTLNFAGPGTEAAWASPVNFLWVRLLNLFHLICSRIFTVHAPDFSVVLDYWLTSLPGVVGIVLISPALAGFAKLPKPNYWAWYGVLGPALLILAIFSSPALPVLHGFQPLHGVLLFLGVWWLSQRYSRTVCLVLVSLQLLFNLSLVLARGLITGVL